MQNESLKNIVFEVNKIIKYYVNIIGVVGRGKSYSSKVV